MIIPTIHLNGSSADYLADGYSTAFTALHQAIQAVEVTAPNARDYYPQGQDAFANARREHADRLQRLHDVQRELSEIHEAVLEARDARKAR